MNAPVIIIGGGIGGLSAAIHLRAAGKPVILIEANPNVGGKMSQVTQNGFRWDAGPSVITMRHVFEELFATAERRLEDYLDLQPVDPLTRYFYPNGQMLDLRRDLALTLESIRRIHPGDEEGYLRFLAYAARLHRITGPVFIYDDPPHLGKLLKVPLSDILQVDGLRTMHQAARGFVRSQELRQLLGRFATYVGASPYQAPATLNVIAHVELNQGVWYPSSGIYSIAEALEKLARELGVEIRTGERAAQIIIKEGRAAGVVLESGQEIPGAAVVANLDVANVYHQLLPPTPAIQKRLARLAAAEPSCSGFILLLGVRSEQKENHPPLAHHNIFFSSDYRREFDEIFQQGVPPTEPTIYIAITSKSTPSDAPAGHENWFILVNAPALGPAWDWDREKQAYRDRVLNLLAARGLDIRNQIVSERILTPMDIEKMSGARRGALYGASSNNRWAAFNRPHNRCPDVKGLYFAGGTTHPGGGVPMVALSGKIAARLLMEDVD